MLASTASTARGLALALPILLAPLSAPLAAHAGDTPPFAAIVVDGVTGGTLHAEDADAPRYPASLTKVMTLYLVFEELESGRLRLDTPLRVSAEAAAEPPSKIGLEPGETIAVEDAILALVTKSANDVAAVVSENLGGSKEAFARRMTARARALGMRNTTFANASGLPDPRQVTTARDMARLALALQERFPEQYRYFSTRSFSFEGERYRNHNRLLGRVEGVDGVKTGFIRASGFNLMTNAKADGRHVVAVVMGGRTGAHRDGVVADLVGRYLPEAASEIAFVRPPQRPEGLGVAEAPFAKVAAAAGAGGRPAARSLRSGGAAPPSAARAYAADGRPVAPEPAP
ncbi:D-alanyl-D-alanine carboxypeptidase family protein [Salinarimonas rosea]|uniref:D-alanyl-D-alanine carboxypeptidase family protein n=1 Tax=Salinarimonas rosea TaxID=552063 RepID=UPI0003F4E216